MTFTEYPEGFEQAPSAFYTHPYPRLQPRRPDIQLTALDRFEEQWRSSQGRVVPVETARSPRRLDYQKNHSPGPPSPNAPFYVPRPHEAPAYQSQDRQGQSVTPHREQICVQVNQAPRQPPVHPSSPVYQPWQRTTDMERPLNHSRPPFNLYQPSIVVPRPATVPPQPYRQQPLPRHLRPESRSRRHPYAESRRGRRSTSSHSKYPPRRKFSPPRPHPKAANRSSVV